MVKWRNGGIIIINIKSKFIIILTKQPARLGQSFSLLTVWDSKPVNDMSSVRSNIPGGAMNFLLKI